MTNQEKIEILLSILGVSGAEEEILEALLEKDVSFNDIPAH